MELKDLKNGMVAELRKGNRFILVNDCMLGDTWCSLKAYNNDLTDKYDRENDIVKIYEVVSGYSVNYILKPNSCYGIELLWNRDDTDWSKVPFGTKVRVWNDEDKKYEGKFLEYYKEDDHDTNPYLIYVKHFDNLWWKNCELIEDLELQYTPTSKELDNGHSEYCDKQDGCSSCKYKSERCVSDYILEHYNVTKK